MRIGMIVSMFSDELRLHGCGVKQQGLLAYGSQLVSADSLAWSFDARKSAPLLGHQHKSCSNCEEFARIWRDDLLDRLGTFGVAAWEGSAND